MTYQTIAAISQSAALLIFIGLFITVVVYAFWPGNKARFDAASRRALDLDKADDNSGDRE